MKQYFVVFMALALLASPAFASQIESKFIKDGAVIEAKIGSSAVTEGKIGSGAVTEGKIGSSAVTEGKIGTGAVTSSKIGANAVGGAAFRLENATMLRARNAAGNADVNLFQLDTNDAMVFSAFPKTPSSAPSANYDTANKKYVDDAIGGIPASKVWLRQSITLSAGDITAQYVDLSQDCVAASVMPRVDGLLGELTSDYTLSVEGGKTRISFVATTGWGTGAPAALAENDVLVVQCQY
jgi:hypothetical protein